MITVGEQNNALIAVPSKDFNHFLIRAIFYDSSFTRRQVLFIRNSVRFAKYLESLDICHSHLYEMRILNLRDCKED